MKKEYDEIEKYRDRMVGLTVTNVDYANADDGLLLEFNDGSTLEIGFSSGYGYIQ